MNILKQHRVTLSAWIVGSCCIFFGSAMPSAFGGTHENTAGNTAVTADGDTQTTSTDVTSNDSALPKLPLWELDFATFARYGQSYPASEDSQVNVVPIVFPIYRGSILRVGAENGKPISTRIFRTDRVKLDLDFGLNFAVDSDDVDARAGMPDLDILAEAGPELEIRLVDRLAGGPLTLAFQLRGAWSFDGLDSTSRGGVFSTELKYIYPLDSPKDELRFRIVPEWASDDYMDFFYGVAPQFETSFRPAFQAKSGYLGTRVGVSLKKYLTDKLLFRTGVNLGLFQGGANRDSPLFTDKTTYSAFIAVVWNFWESERREPEPDQLIPEEYIPEVLTGQ